MKKLFSVFIVLLLAVCSIFAGGSNETAGAGTSASSGKEELRVVTFFAGSDECAPLWAELKEEYQAAHPDVVLVDESQPTAGANDLFRTKIQAELAANTPADVILFYNGSDGKTILDSGLYVDMKPYMDADPEWSDNLIPAAMEAGVVDGVQICIPAAGFYEGLFYNKKLFDQFGLEYPTTFENILTAVDVFNENGIIPIAGSLMKPSYMLEIMILAQVGAEGQSDYFDESWAPALENIKTLYERGAFPADTMTLSEDDLRMLFAEEKAAMMFNGNWCVAMLKDNPDMRILSMPVVPGGKGGEDTALSGFGSGWYMSKAAAERSDTAIEFIKWMTSPEIMARFIAVSGSPSVKCDPPEGSSPLEESALEMLSKAVYQRNAIDSQVTRESWLTLAEPGLQYVVTGQVDPVDLLEQAASYNY